MRKNYVKPALISEEFVPQTYIAACPEIPGYTIYSFTCNAGKGTTHYGSKYVWKVTTSNGEVIAGGNGEGNYGPCSKTHEVKVPKGTPANQVFDTGYMDDVYTDRNENISVYIWRGANNDNCHCMLNPGHQDIDIPKNMS